MKHQPDETKSRINDIVNSQLTEYIDEAVCNFQSELSLSPQVYATEVYIVGSVLTEDFRPGDSDIDILVGTNDKPHKHMINNFFRYWNDIHGYNTALHKDIDINFSKVDVCKIQKNTHLRQEVLREPNHRMKI